MLFAQATAFTAGSDSLFVRRTEQTLLCSAIPMALHPWIIQYPIRNSLWCQRQVFSREGGGNEGYHAGASTVRRVTTARKSRGAVMQYSMYRNVTAWIAACRLRVALASVSPLTAVGALSAPIVRGMRLFTLAISSVDPA